MDTTAPSEKLMTKLRELADKPDGWGEIRMIEPADARAILAAHPTEQRMSDAARDDRTKDVGTWLWCEMMDYCSASGLAPSTQNQLFEIVGRARQAFPCQEVIPPIDNFSHTTERKSDASRMQRLIDACEGELDGLAISEEKARAIMRHVDAATMQTSAQKMMDEGFAEIAASDAFEVYLNTQKRIVDMPGLKARPCFIAGYMAAIDAARKAEIKRSEAPDEK